MATTIQEIGAKQHGVFSREQALASGFSEWQVDWRLSNGAWMRMDTGVYAFSSATATWERQLHAAYLSRPGGIVTGRSAARLHGFPNVHASKPEILIPFTGNARSPIARIIRSRLFDLVDYRQVAGLRVTTIPETLLVLSYRNPKGLIERWVDSQLADGRLTAAEFDPIFARLTNARVRGLPSLRKIVIARDRDSYQPPTSELEHLLYPLLDRRDLPDYNRQLPIEYEQTNATVDAYIEEWRMIVEADGRRWHTRKADFERDRERDNAAAAKGIQVIRFTYRMLKDDAERCVRTLKLAGSHR